MTGPATRKACRITRITTYVVGMRWRNCVFARVETDDGISGVGEGTLEYQPQAVEAAIDQLAARYVDRQVRVRDRAAVATTCCATSSCAAPIINSAIAALEMAMWDIVGKALGRPVYDLLGGRVHEACRPTPTPGTAPAARRRRSARRRRRAAAKGYRGLKFDPFERRGPRPGPRRDPPRRSRSSQAVRGGVGPDVDIMIDAHGRFSPGAAIAIARELEPAELYWLEEPCDPENAAALAAVGRDIKTRLATGERCYQPLPACRRCWRRNEIDVLQPDIIHVGGILEAKKIAAMADAYYMPVSFHNPFGPVATAAAVQLDACTTNFVMQESFCEYDVPWRFDLRRARAAPRERPLRRARPPGPRHRRIPPRGRAGASVRSRRLPAAVPPRVGDAV